MSPEAQGALADAGPFAWTADPTGPLLAFDTSGPVGSVALAVEGRVIAVNLLAERTEHAARLLPAIHATLEEAGLAPRALSGIVVGEGPGSFTGVRVAAATAKGLALAGRIPLRPVSSLAAAAIEGLRGGPQDTRSPVYALFDARGDRVYGACYGIRDGRLEVLVSPHPGEIGDVLSAELPPGVRFVGDAAEKHRARLADAGYRVHLPEAPAVLAVGLLMSTGLEAAPPTPDPGGWEPQYVRASSVERMWSL